MTQEEKVIKNTIGLLKCAEHLESVSKASTVMGFSRDSFDRYKPLYEQGEEAALHEMRRKKPVVKHRVEAAIEQAVCAFAIEYPAYEPHRVSHA